MRRRPTVACWALLLALTLVAVPAQAQDNGSIGLYEDLGATDCQVNPTGSPQFIHVIFHRGPDLPSVGITAVEYNIDFSQFVAQGMVWLADNHQGVTSNGTTNPAGTGVQMGFASCQTSEDIHLNSVSVFFGAPVTGGPYWATVTESNLATDTLTVVDCTPLAPQHDVMGGQATLNGPCNVGTQQTTFGRIKALYHRRD
jgi:hypothetical protein